MPTEQLVLRQGYFFHSTRKAEHIQRHNGTFPSVRAFLSIAHLRPPPRPVQLKTISYGGK